jgi:hypothetical protein
MKKLELNRNANRVDDASIVREVRPPRRWLRPVLAVAVLIALAAALWQAYVLYFKPRHDQQKVEAALVALSAAHKRPAYFEALKAKPREQFLLELFGNLRSPSPGLDEQVRIAGARAALDLAISQGSDEAGLELGKAHRDGVFGAKDNTAALREFERVNRRIEPGVKVGDSIALYVHAITLSEGLGVNLDRQAAVAMLKRASDGLTGWRLRAVAQSAAWGTGYFADGTDLELARRIASRLMDAGDHSAYTIGTLACLSRPSLSKKDRDTFSSQTSLSDCTKPWVSKAAIAGNRSAMADFADVLLDEVRLDDARKWYEAAGSERDASQNYNFGSLQVLTARDEETLLRGVKVMWLALQANNASEHPLTSLGDNWQLSNALIGDDKIRERSNIAVAMMVHGELAGTVGETVSRIRALDSLVGDAGRGRRQDSLSALIDLQAIRDRGRLVYLAIRSNKTVAEVAADVQSSRMAAVPTKQSATKNSVLPQTAAAASQPDPEQQSRSGRLAGSSRAARGGLSTFAVDNLKSDRDAVVRLYVEGRLPAVRSFYVKLGEKFTETAIAPGTYVMRYRFIGSEDTFEADKQFVLAESEISGGRRYSKVSVTLFKQSDGNLSMKKVAPGQF